MIVADRILDLQNRIALSDDQSAYKELFTEFYSYLYRFARSFVKSKQIAEEIVSDVFIKIWEKRRELERIANLKVYLYIATRNIALNYLDKQKRSDTNNLESFASGIKSFYFNPEQLMITAEMMKRIQKAIDDLPARCKLVFKLVKEDGLKYREAAEILQISVKTVENQLAIALHKIGHAVSFDIKRSIYSPC
jgi:RNA polymerase sigma-70 factor (ECF subfamily)